MTRGRLPVHGMARTPTYQSWKSMRASCDSPADPQYFRYGAAGVKVCPRWRDFANFLADMGERPPGTTLDRIEGSKGYEPGNCRWATRLLQTQNRDRTIWLEFQGKRLTLQQWSDDLTINYTTLFRRLRRGWSVERTLSEPMDSRFSRANLPHSKQQRATLERPL